MPICWSVLWRLLVGDEVLGPCEAPRDRGLETAAPAPAGHAGPAQPHQAEAPHGQAAGPALLWSRSTEP